MSPRIEPVAPTGAEATTLYVAIEISRKSWVVGLKSPLGEKIGLHTLAAARGGVRMAARGTGPAGMGRIHRDQPRRLVREHRAETAPARRQDPAVQAGLLPDVPPGRFHRALRRCRHRARPQCLDHYRAPGQRPAHLVLPVAASLRDPPLRARQPSPRALAPSRAVALPGDDAWQECTGAQPTDLLCTLLS